MSIKHNRHLDGKVQSLGFNKEGTDYTVGVVMPGDHKFGKAERREIIRVIAGTLVINGFVYAVPMSVNLYTGDCVIEPGEEIHVIANRPAAYICRYE